MNCFQNCIFTWHSQFINFKCIYIYSCELLSELYFYLAFAVDFLLTLLFFSCELLSELYFYLAFAVPEKYNTTAQALWIAFRIVFLLGIRSRFCLRVVFSLVVNCFQNCIFTWHSQCLSPLLTASTVVNCFQNCIFTWHSQCRSLSNC